MRRIALVVFAVGSLAVAGQALAGPGGRYGGHYGGRHHGGGGGNVAAALFGGAILGIVAGSIISNANNPREVVVESPVYVAPSSCYDVYSGLYVQCNAPTGYAPIPYRDQAPYPQSGRYQSDPQSNYADRQDAPPSAQPYQYQDPASRSRESQRVTPVYADGARPMGDRYDGPAGNR